MPKVYDPEFGKLEALVYTYSEEKADAGWVALDSQKKTIVFKESGLYVKSKDKTLEQM